MMMGTYSRTTILCLAVTVLYGALDVRPVRAQADEDVRLEFEDADIRAVIAALAELMGANVTYGSLPSRTVTLKTNRPVPRDSLPAIFAALLESNGLELERSGGVMRIREAQARASRARPQEQETEEPVIHLFVIRLRHTFASDVAATVNALFGAGLGGYGGGPSLSTVGLSQSLRENLVPPGTGREAPAPPPAAPQAAAEEAQLEAEVTIVPDVTTNSLLIRATEHDFEVIQDAVEELDVRPRQVMIEVLVAEARRDALTRIGLEVFVSNAPSGSDPQIEAELSERVLGNFVTRIMHLDDLQVDALFDALSTSSDVSILSRPVLVASNNQEAHILVGSERPFIQVSRSLPTDAATRDQVVQYRDVGTKLTLIPTINHDGYVTLTLRQEVSAATSETQFGAPVISTREASTRLLVADGQTVVIGGLIDRQKEKVRSGIPLLKDIPVVGLLFGSTSWRTTETELFLFLTPHVLATDEDAERATEEIQEGSPRLRGRLPSPLLPGDTAAADTTGLRPDGIEGGGTW